MTTSWLGHAGWALQAASDDDGVIDLGLLVFKSWYSLQVVGLMHLKCAILISLRHLRIPVLRVDVLALFRRSTGFGWRCKHGPEPGCEALNMDGRETFWWEGDLVTERPCNILCTCSILHWNVRALLCWTTNLYFTDCFQGWVTKCFQSGWFDNKVSEWVLIALWAMEDLGKTVTGARDNLRAVANWKVR